MNNQAIGLCLGIYILGMSLTLQNIDSLERQAGLSEAELIQAHGSFTTASCTADGCTHTCSGAEVRINSCSCGMCSFQ